MEAPLRVLAKTAPPLAHDAAPIGPVDPRAPAIVTLRLRSSDAAERALVEKFAHAASLPIVSSGPKERSVVVRASLAALCRAFTIEMRRFTCAAGDYRSNVGPIALPAHLHDIVEAVLGLDDRPQLRRKFARVPQHFIESSAAAGAYTAPELARLYDFPADFEGAGQSVGIIALGGGYDLADLQAYFGALGLALPRIELVSVDGAANAPGRDQECDAEVTFDLEIVGSLIPAARIVVYLAPDTDQGFLDAVDTAIHDDVRRPQILSISLGQPESSWSKQLIDAFDRVLQEAARAGITVVCASGDGGSGCGMPDGRAHAEFPASSPWVLACGGTTLRSAGTTIGAETVWNELASARGASGGGISDLYDVPHWQTCADVPPSLNPGARRGRGVPDVAANADQGTGYRVRLAGRDLVAGGTSAAAPLWAALIARINQALGTPVGFINPALYRHDVATSALRAIVEGNNGAYSAQPGWNACAGLGTPRGQALLAALKAVKSAGYQA